MTPGPWIQRKVSTMPLTTIWQPLNLFDGILLDVPTRDDNEFLDDGSLSWYLILTTETLNLFRDWTDQSVVVISDEALRGRPLDPLWTQRARGRIVFVPGRATVGLKEGQIEDLNTRLRLYGASVHI